MKSKSMVTEEMELNHVLEEAGIRAIETDLGEYIVQLAGQRPIHLVTPAMHFSAEEVGQLFHEKLGEPYSAEHAALTAIARKHLRAEYLAAGMGISGCNFAVADSGTVVVVENEGNAGLSTATPPVHVVLVGIEKVIPRIDHLPLFLNLLGPQRHRPEADDVYAFDPRSGGGQEALRDLSGQRPDEGPAGPACLAVAVLHPLRGVPERLPGLPPRGRLVVRLDLSGADRLGAHAAPRRPGEGGQAAVRLVAVRGLRRGLPGEDRHSPPTGPSPPSRGERAFAHELGL